MGRFVERLVAKMFRQNCGNGISKTDRDFLKELTAFKRNRWIYIQRP